MPLPHVSCWGPRRLPRSTWGRVLCRMARTWSCWSSCRTRRIRLGRRRWTLTIRRRPHITPVSTAAIPRFPSRRQRPTWARCRVATPPLQRRQRRAVIILLVVRIRRAPLLAPPTTCSACLHRGARATAGPPCRTQLFSGARPARRDQPAALAQIVNPNAKAGASSGRRLQLGYARLLKFLDDRCAFS